MNETIRKFGYPESAVGELDHWAILTRPQQATLGCLVLAERSDATSLSGISAEAAAELPLACGLIERMLGGLWSPRRFNYLALMMVDPNVHFHVIPRYDSDRSFDGVTFVDAGWPKLPDLGSAADLSAEQLTGLTAVLRSAWAQTQ